MLFGTAGIKLLSSKDAKQEVCRFIQGGTGESLPVYKKAEGAIYAGSTLEEAVAEADTIVFDKTGTLTKAEPTVADAVSFNGQEPDELLWIAACLEEHFPHSVAKDVVEAAKEKKLR